MPPPPAVPSPIWTPRPTDGQVPVRWAGAAGFGLARARPAHRCVRPPTFVAARTGVSQLPCSRRYGPWGDKSSSSRSPAGLREVLMLRPGSLGARLPVASLAAVPEVPPWFAPRPAPGSVAGVAKGQRHRNPPGLILTSAHLWQGSALMVVLNSETVERGWAEAERGARTGEPER